MPRPLFAALSYAVLGLLGLLVAPRAQAQAPAWQTAIPVALSQHNGNSLVEATAVDAAGNVYLAGTFSGVITLGSTTLVSQDAHDIFLTRWDPAAARFTWAVRAGGEGSDFVSSLVVAERRLYVVGTISGPADFGDTDLTSAGGVDGFVAKLTDEGRFIWAKPAGGSGFDTVYGLAVAGGSVYIAGNTVGEVSLDGLRLTSSTREGDGYVAKLSDAGPTARFAWAQSIRSSSSAAIQRINALALHGSNVYVTGRFSGTAQFGASRLTSPTSETDVFVAKLTDSGSTGSFVWAHQLGGDRADYATALAVRGTNVYLAGNVDFEPFTSSNINLIGGGRSKVFVAKLTDAGPSGQLVWVQQAARACEGQYVALAVAGPNLYLTGAFSGRIAFGGNALEGAGGTRSDDVFVAKLTDAGSTGGFTWAQQISGPDTEVAGALALSGASVYVGGGFGLTARFGSQTITSPGFQRSGFLASLTDATLTPTTGAQPERALRLYPNPARGSTTVELPAGPGAATASLTLLDALGRPVRTRAVAVPTAGLRHELSLAGLPAGFYVLHVTTGGTRTTRRLVVE